MTWPNPPQPAQGGQNGSRKPKPRCASRQKPDAKPDARPDNNHDSEHPHVVIS
jgi:hypothetical protein